MMDRIYEDKIAKLEAEVDQLRVQLAGCGVAASGGLDSSQRANKGDFGWSPVYEDVVTLALDNHGLRAANQALVAQLKEAEKKVAAVMKRDSTVVRVKQG